ncbi:hypothetical protein FACS189467_7280 [Bacteroidia bacterium]|nr:hypothetical protein FACS189467_7280 [Bacteroidia bacterium]
MDESQEIQAVKKFISELFNKVKNNPHTDNNAITIGKLSPAGAKYLSDISGIRIKTATRFTISENYLRHLYNNHYGDNEKDKGQNVPLTDDDVVALIDVISTPNDIVFMGYNRKEQANEFSFVRTNNNGTYSLLEVYSNSDGTLKPKTFYNSKRSIGGQVMNLIKNSQPYTSQTRTRPIDTSKPEILFVVSNKFFKSKGTTNFSEKQENSQK